ncbi:NERD domain-containing protein [Streptomyces cahuitamycinicus]|uniref:NERD domain-containing protein n=1 Tax=Streptomyces cahuitamycinicus TaxID=2070367 RepID=UPI001FE39230|nr:NERD domain-containing protein [Streptomyces cahuitamycinicus]
MGARQGLGVRWPAAAPTPRERWFQPRRSGFRWEQEGLDHLRGLTPRTEPCRAWATFQFTGASGRINECDVLIAVPGGVYLLELKGHPGRVVNHGARGRSTVTTGYGLCATRSV